MRFRLVPKSSTLDDLELLYVQILLELSATELLRTESTSQRCIDYVDISG